MLRQNRKTALLTDVSAKSSLSEVYNVLRTHAQYADSQRETRSICITSCLPGEGKSLTAANLAISYALEGKRTLLIDADLRSPTLHKWFGVSNTQGLSYLLRQPSAAPESQLHPTMVDNLHLLPAGTQAHHPSELLASGKLEQLLEGWLKDTFDVLILDTPPVLMVTDAQIVARMAEGVLLVVGVGKTKRSEALKAKELLQRVKGNVLGVVLNGKKMSVSDERMYRRYKSAAE